MKGTTGAIFLAISLLLVGCNPPITEKTKISGWNIIADDLILADKAIETGKKYGINQLHLSGDICSSLRDAREPRKRTLVNYLARQAHKTGIQDVLIWNQALYNLDFYPFRFRTGGAGVINLDDPEFWKWFKDDYRKMLKLFPEINGLVLNFNEWGTQIEDQYSAILKTHAEKRAALVDSVASVVINELNLKLYIRNFRYNFIGQKANPKSYWLIKCPGIIVMEKVTPGVNLLTGPVSEWIKDIPYPVLVEFDCTHESDGQGVVAGVFPGIYLDRWKYYQKFPNVAGYSALIQLSDENSVLENPGEVNLYALQAATKNPQVNLDEVLTDYISGKYDSLSIPFLKPAFEKAPDIILSSFYTLCLNTTDHSQLNFENRLTYTSNVAGRWMENPVVKIGHGINRQFHYWTDIVNHLAPAWYKQPDLINQRIIPEVFSNNWLQPEELMDSTWLDYVLTEKQFGINLAKEALVSIKSAKSSIHDSQKFNTLYHIFNRTLISARLWKAYTQVYYGQRIWQRGESFRNLKLKTLIQEGMDELDMVSTEMDEYREKGPIGLYAWERDAQTAKKLVAEIRKSGILTSKNKLP
jgi:hypothetical protein